LGDSEVFFWHETSATERLDRFGRRPRFPTYETRAKGRLAQVYKKAIFGSSRSARNHRHRFARWPRSPYRLPCRGSARWL